MKRNWTSQVIAISILTAGGGAIAQTPINGMAGPEVMLPYIAPSNCGTSVQSPEDGGPVFFSRNCKYAFIGPRTKAALRIRSFVPSMNILQCEAIRKNHESIRQLEDLKIKTIAKIGESQAGGSPNSNVEKLLSHVKLMDETLNGLRRSFAAVEGARSQVEFDLGQGESEMRKYRELNYQAIDLQHLIFVRAPIAEGFLSMTLADMSPEAAKLDPMVLRSDIPGFRAPNQPEGTISMNGSAAGSLTLSLSGACALIKDYQFETPAQVKVDEEKVKGLVAANYTYSIPVQSGLEYEAKIESANMISAIVSQTKTSSQFSINDLLRVNNSGQSAQWCTINIKRYEVPANDPIAKSNFENELSGSTCATLAQRMLARMQTKGAIDAFTSQAPLPAAAQAGGNVLSTAYRRVCHETRFLGIRVGGGCNDEPYTVARWQDGRSGKDYRLEDSTEYSESQSVSINSTLTRWFTTSFTP